MKALGGTRRSTVQIRLKVNRVSQSATRRICVTWVWMLIKTSCHRVLATNAVLKSFVEDMQAHLDRYSHKVEITEIPPLAAAYPQLAREDADYLFEPYPILRRPSPSETCIIMHSSGSTGIPKPIRQTHLACTRLATLSPEWKEYSPHLVLGCMALPAFNPFAVVLEIFHPAFTVITIALFPPVYITGGIPRTPSPQAIIEHAKATIANALVAVPPVFIESWAKSPETIEYLKSLEFIAYAGLNLIPKIGNQLASAGVRLQSIYGGTELGIPVSTLPNRDVMDWEYVRFIQDVNVRWISLEVNSDMKSQACQTHRPAILNLPDVEGFATSDIFKPHPVKEGLWKNVGRLFDIIVHSSGEKTIPRPIEDVIMGDAFVKGAVVFGEGYNQPGVLIEVVADAQVDTRDQVEVSHLRDQVWPIIEEANKEAPIFSKIVKQLVLFTAIGRPLPRTDKLTIQRKVAIELYALEISEVYGNL
ncbi:hypothetical protein E4T56_gene780 [Termitomyces sp. T112]|nr:hypothetical protein E4T56_gene780 [Termitomyces sp. T112]